MRTLYFNFYGFNVRINCRDFNLHTFSFIKDFSFFKSTKSQKKVDLNIYIENIFPEKSTGLYLSRTKMCRFYQKGFFVREYEYILNDKITASAELISRYEKVFRVRSLSINAVDDILYFFILSSVGESMDLRGMMRLHALSFKNLNITSVVYADSGSGKSTLAKQIIDEQKGQLYSDEITVVDINSQKILPFPIRIGLIQPETKNHRFNIFFDSKNMFSIEKNRIAKPDASQNFIYMTVSKNSEIQTMTKLDFMFLIPKIILGIGLIQMAEHLIRPDSIFLIFRILTNRFRLILTLKKMSGYKYKNGHNDSTVFTDQFLK